MNFADDERIIVKDVDYIVDHFTGQKEPSKARCYKSNKKTANG